MHASIVLLLRTPPAATLSVPQVCAAALGDDVEVTGESAQAGDPEGATRHVLAYAGHRYSIVCAPSPFPELPFVEGPEEVCEGLRAHQGWIAIDWVRTSGQPSPTEIYPVMGKVIAAACSESALVLYAPRWERFATVDRWSLENLVSDQPLADFGVRCTPRWCECRYEDAVLRESAVVGHYRSDFDHGDRGDFGSSRLQYRYDDYVPARRRRSRREGGVPRASARRSGGASFSSVRVVVGGVIVLVVLSRLVMVIQAGNTQSIHSPESAFTQDMILARQEALRRLRATRSASRAAMSAAQAQTWTIRDAKGRPVEGEELERLRRIAAERLALCVLIAESSRDERPRGTTVDDRLAFLEHLVNFARTDARLDYDVEQDRLTLYVDGAMSSTSAERFAKDYLERLMFSGMWR